MDDHKREQHRQKITDAARRRMLATTAKQQLAQALEEARRGPQDIPLPDADDASLRGVLR
jgi:hypothetical protein